MRVKRWRLGSSVLLILCCVMDVTGIPQGVTVEAMAAAASGNGAKSTSVDGDSVAEAVLTGNGSGSHLGGWCQQRNGTCNCAASDK
jgi:hypothetical protein